MADIPGPYCLAGGLAIVERDGKTWVEVPSKNRRPLTPKRADIIAHWLLEWAREQEAAEAAGEADGQAR